jgi:hypothetical protein
LNLPPKKNLKLLSTRRSRAWELVLFAACGGENGSRYFKNRAPLRKLQGFARRLAELGGSLVLYFGLKNELAVSFGGKKKF